jgi:hypothetical protein
VGAEEKLEGPEKQENNPIVDIPISNNHLFGTLEEERAKLNALAEEQRKKAAINAAKALVNKYPTIKSRKSRY